MEGLSFRQRALVRLAVIVLLLNGIMVLSIVLMLMTGFMRIYWDGCQCPM